ncbi:MAG TPA: DUF5753 domain-containing protein [Trebonia sp.]
MLLANALKRRRQTTGRRQKEVADDLGWPVSKLIRAESSSTRILRSDLEALLSYYGISDQGQIDELSGWAREVRIPGWWHKFNIQDEAFERYVGYESGATSIRMVQDLLVPGVLQTEEYANVIVDTYNEPSKADSLVALRLERQDEIFARGPKQHHILDEAVLRRRVGDVMPGQLRHLIDLAQKPKITIQIVPFEVGPHFGMRGSFVLLGFDVPISDLLFLESGQRSDLIVSQGEMHSGQGIPGTRDPAEIIARYEDGFGALSQAALNQTESIHLLKEIVNQLRLACEPAIGCELKPGRHPIAVLASFCCDGQNVN